MRGTPTAALLATSSVALLLVGLGDLTRGGFSTMVDYLSPVYWGFLLLSGVALMVLRRKEPQAERPFKVPLYPGCRCSLRLQRFTCRGPACLREDGAPRWGWGVGAGSFAAQRFGRPGPPADRHLLATRHGQLARPDRLGDGRAAADGGPAPMVTGATSTQLETDGTSSPISVRCLLAPS